MKSLTKKKIKTPAAKVSPKPSFDNSNSNKKRKMAKKKLKNENKHGGKQNKPMESESNDQSMDDLSIDSFSDDSDIDPKLHEDLDKLLCSLNFEKFRSQQEHSDSDNSANSNKKMKEEFDEKPSSSGINLPKSKISDKNASPKAAKKAKTATDQSLKNSKEKASKVSKTPSISTKDNKLEVINKESNKSKKLKREKKLEESSKDINEAKNPDKKNKFDPSQLKLALQGIIPSNDSKMNKLSKVKKNSDQDSSNAKQGSKNLKALKDAKKEDLQPKVTAGEAFKQKLVGQLNSASFRYWNEQLYTATGAEAFETFQKDKGAYKIYHEGYNLQLSQWPMNPRSIIAKWMAKKPKNWVVADFGCGDGSLGKSIPQKVISLDLVASSPGIIECDMAHTPLDTSSVDAVVFCLSLMGTNLRDYFIEANRVLKENGVLKIAEVESRFSSVDLFLKNLFKYGFKCIHKDLNQKYFYLFTLLKWQRVKKNQNLPAITLNPCIYKKR